MAQKSLRGAERVAQSERRRLPGWHNERCRRARKGAGSDPACGTERAAREGQRPMVNMGQSPIPHYYYNGVVCGESSCGGHKERHRKARKWHETQRAVCEDKKAVLSARNSMGRKERRVRTKK